MSIKQLWHNAVNRSLDDSYRAATVGKHNPDSTITYAVTGRADFLWITFPDQTTAQARNDAGVPQTADLEVWVRREYNPQGGPSPWVIEGRSAAGGLSVPTPTPADGVYAHTLGSHSDVTITAAANGDVLAHNGTAWVDETPVTTSAGAGDAGKLVRLDAGGQIDATMINDADIDLDNVTEGASNKFYTAAEQTKLAGIETAADVTDAGNIASSITGVSTDDTIVDADVWGYLTGGVLVKTTWSNIKSVLNTYLAGVYQPLNTLLTALAALTTAANKGLYFTGSNTPATYDLTAAGRAILDDADAAAQRTTLALGNVDNTSDATKNAAAVTVTNHTYDSTNIASLTAKNPPIDADSAVIVDSAASNVFKRVTYTNIKAFLKTYFDTLYAPTANGVTNGDSHDHSGGDGAQIDHGGLAGLSDDDHSIYALLAGRSGGQRITGIASTGYALEVYRDLPSASTSAAVMAVTQDEAGDDQEALRLQQDGTGAVIVGYDGATKVFELSDGGTLSIYTVIKALTASGIQLQDDGGNAAVAIADGGATTVGVDTAVFTPVASGVGQTYFGNNVLLASLVPGNITTSQTWTIDITVTTANNNRGGVLNVLLYDLGSAVSPSSLRLLYKADIAWYRTTVGSTATITAVNESIRDSAGVTLTGPTAIADGIRYTVHPTAGTLNRVAGAIMGVEPGATISSAVA